MNYRIALAMGLAALSSSAHSMAPCVEKQQDIQREIGFAEKNHNQSRIAGLNKALREVRDSCSNGELRAAHQQKILKQQQKIVEYRRNLVAAKNKGDADKIGKLEHELKEAQSQLKALESRSY